MSPETVPRASALETAGFLADVAIPLFARGTIIRRPRIEGLLDRLDADRRAVRRLQRLRERHGEGPLLLRVPGRAVAVVLSPDHARRVLDGAPQLWPTTPAILRDATERTGWEAGTLPAGAAVLVFAPFFHRDGERLEFADTFSPQLWLDGGATDRWVLIPFSAGPASCPGRDLVLFTTSSLLGALLAGASLAQSEPRALDATGPMPANLSPFRLRFDVREAQAGGSRSRVLPR